MHLHGKGYLILCNAVNCQIIYLKFRSEGKYKITKSVDSYGVLFTSTLLECFFLKKKEAGVAARCLELICSSLN